MSRTTARRLAAFAAVLLAVFASAFAVGRTAGPPAPGAGHEDAHTGDVPAPRVDGVQVSAGGYRVEPPVLHATAKAGQQLRFRIVRDGGSPVRNMVEDHGARLHLVLVRRDLTGYQHLHPTQTGDGAWEVTAAFPGGGAHRAYADFRVAGGGPVVLGFDILVAGAFDPRPLPPPAPSTTTDGYAVDLAVRGDEFVFAIRRDGAAVELEPHLGAKGHLVAVRSGDLAYVHLHPRDAVGRRYSSRLPGPGTYRLYLQFSSSGAVRTAELTHVVG